ncbi:MAG: flagellar hook-length control protein FliK, partial [Betaproteobacteria bacterium]|nr:flagellar hook-length control protein FliK [Betaproteobacteria bacterium]
VATAAAPGESPAGESSGSCAGAAPPDLPPMALPGLASASASAPGIGLTGASPVTAEATDDSHATRPAAAFPASGIDTLPRGAPPAGRGAVPAVRDRSAEGDARAPAGALAAAEARALPGLHAALVHGPESGESAPPQPGSAGAGLAQIAPQPLPQAAPNTATTPARYAIAAPLDTPAWRESFVSQVGLALSQGVQSAEIRIHPAELGPVSVRIQITDGQASVAFVAAAEETRAAIERALPELREQFSEIDVRLGDASVGAGFAGRSDAREARAHPALPGIAAPGDELATTHGAPAARSERLIDVYA